MPASGGCAGALAHDEAVRVHPGSRRSCSSRRQRCTARAIVDAFRGHFGSHTRLHALKQIAATLGVAGLLHFVAFRFESAIRTDMIPGLAVAAEQRAALVNEAPGFRGDGGQEAAPRTIPRRYAMGVAGAAFMCAVTITLLVRV
jgi:hypothetical protein